MTAFASIPAPARSAVLTLLLLGAFCALALLLIQVLRKKTWQSCLASGLVYLLQSLLMLALLCADKQDELAAFARMPWAVPTMLSLGLSTYPVVGLVRAARREKQDLTPDAIRQFIDNMPTALCFAAPSGRIILKNRQMVRLSFALSGLYPQMLDELVNALQQPRAEYGVQAIAENEGYYRFADRTIWRFSMRRLTGALEGWTQVTAEDMTALYQGKERLQADNLALSEVNAKLQLMYDNMADAIREKESLEMKIYIHDTLGRSLITLQDILDDSEDDMQKKMEALQSAVSALSSNRKAFAGTFEDAQHKAQELGVTVDLDGYIPSDTVMERLIVHAVRECVTNCVRHAEGNRVRVKIRELAGVYTVTITNNGKPPQGSIAEGSGLSALRQRVQAAGGEMRISTEPAFALILNLSRRECVL